MIGSTDSPFPKGPFGTILVDPPWPYRQKFGATIRGHLPYETMTEDEIKAFPVGYLAAKDCILFLWTTNSHLPLALECAASWGFEYKTMVTWDKLRLGMGYWLRGQTEHLILAIRGNPRDKFVGPNGAAGHAWSTIIRESRGPHSAKPETSYQMIEYLGPDPKIELFARTRRPGWTQWGNQAPSPEENPTLEEVW